MAFNTVSALLAAGGEDISNLFVVIMGVGIVFLGLLSIVILTTIMSAVIRALEGKKTVEAPAAAPTAPAAAPIFIMVEGENGNALTQDAACSCVEDTASSTDTRLSATRIKACCFPCKVI